jgi:hypothetical protein
VTSGNFLIDSESRLRSAIESSGPAAGGGAAGGATPGGHAGHGH